MNIDFDTLARLIQLTETAKIHSLHIQDGTQTVILTNPSQPLPQVLSQAAPHTLAQMSLQDLSDTPQNQISSTTPPTEPTNFHTITSPMLGTFYRKSAPDSPNFVEIGDAVKAGDTLCIVEAMKIMHEVKADKAGMVREILVDEGQMVEYDSPLFVIE